MIGRRFVPRQRRTRKTQLAYLLMCYRVHRATAPAFLVQDFCSRQAYGKGWVGK